MDRALISWRGAGRTDAAAALERAEAERLGLAVDGTLPGGTLVRADAANVRALEARGYRVKVLPDVNVLRIGSYRIDVERGDPEVPPELDVPQSEAGVWPHHLVQLIAPPDPEWSRAIEARGVHVVERVGPYGLFVTGPPQTAQDLTDLPFVEWVGAFKPAYKIHPALLDAEGTIRFVSVSVFPPEETESVEEAVADLGARVEHRWDAPPVATDYAVLIVEADAALVPALAAIPHVRWLEFEPPRPILDGERETQIVAENLDATPAPNTAPVTGYQAWLADVGLSGAGVSIAIVDSGIDQNASNNATGHLDVRGRQATFVDYTAGASPTDTDGHGTHVAGIAIGNAASGDVDGDNFLRGQGMAPGAAYVTQNFTDDNRIFPPGGYPSVTKDSVVGGAHVMNNSWANASEPGGYTANARTFDRLVRDPDETSAGIDYLAIVFSAGNSGGGASTITPPHEAKNPIIVGNSLTSRPSLFPSDDVRGIAGTSSRGPAADGRILPHVVAPGTDVLSAATGTTDDHATGSGTSMSAPHVTGACALLIEWWRTQHGGQNPSPAMLKALLVNGAVDVAGGANWRATNRRPADKAAWSVHSGNVHKRTLWFTPSQVVVGNTPATQVASLATLTAAGQWFFDSGTNEIYVWMPGDANPASTSSSFVYGLDAPVAPVPNGDQGWGRASLDNVLLQAPVADRGPKVFFDSAAPFTASGQEFLTEVVPWDSALPLRVTLAWTDVPGAAGANPALVNDLDLEVTEMATGNVYKGNVFSNGFSVVGGTFDSIDNVECVYVPNPAGTYSIRVVAAGVTANALPPYDATTPWQDFALVVENVDVPSPAPVNVVPVLDRSGSMVSSGYVDVTKLATKQFVDATRINDGLGVVSFGDTGDVEFPGGPSPTLQTVTGQATRVAAKTEIDTVAFGGCTFMGDGLAKAGALLAASEPRAIVLLSDGYDNKGCDAGNLAKPSGMDAAGVLPPNTRVFTCAMGPASDQALLEQIAAATGGEYYYMPTIEDLVEIYNYIQADVNNESLVANESASASRSSVAALVDAAASAASFNVTWTDRDVRFTSREPRSSGEISVRLRDPHGRLLHPAITNLRTVVGDGYVILKLDDPESGLWHVEVETVADFHVRYTVGAFVRSPLRLDILPPRTPPRVGVPLPVVARVLDGRRSVPAVGSVQVVAPGAAIPDLLHRHAARLKDVRLPRDWAADAATPQIAQLVALRRTMLKDERVDLFATRRLSLRLQTQKTPALDLGALRLPALGAGPILRGLFKDTSQAGTYNVTITASGLSPVTNTRFIRKALMSVRVPS